MVEARGITEKVEEDAKEGMEHQKKKTQLTTIHKTPSQTRVPPSSSLQHNTLVSIILGDTPEKRDVPEEEVADLGYYYFSKVHQVVLGKTPKKHKVNGIGQEIVVSEEPKTVWKIPNQPKQRISNDTVTVLWHFGDANKTIVKNLSDEVNQLT